MGKARMWTQAEDDYLEDKWGTRASITGIAKKLNRSVESIKLRAGRMGLGPKLMAGEWVTLCQLYKTVTGSRTYNNYCMTSWVKNRGLPIKQVKVIQSYFRVVYIEDFWQWAEANKTFLDFSKMEHYALGAEPAWVEQKRVDDCNARTLKKTNPWTAEQDAWLKLSVRQHKTCAEIARLLRRSEGAIVRRCQDKGYGNPRRRPAHDGWWSREQYRLLRDLALDGKPWALIARAVGKSEKACRGHAYNIWRTESLDKLRAVIASGVYEGRYQRLLNGRGRTKEAAQ